MLGTSFLGDQGVLCVLVTLAATLLIKTLTLWAVYFNTTESTITLVGDYALMADNYKLSLVLLLDNYSLSYIALTNVIGV